MQPAPQKHDLTCAYQKSPGQRNSKVSGGGEDWLRIQNRVQRGNIGLSDVSYHQGSDDFGKDFEWEEVAYMGEADWMLQHLRETLQAVAKKVISKRTES